jgi:hypothetical protein
MSIKSSAQVVDSPLVQPLLLPVPDHPRHLDYPRACFLLPSLAVHDCFPGLVRFLVPAQLDPQLPRVVLYRRRLHRAALLPPPLEAVSMAMEMVLWELTSTVVALVP